MSEIYASLRESSPVAVVIISVAFMLFTGFLMTRITKMLKLPNVTAYIVAGILIGPYCFDLVADEVLLGMEFIADISLAFIAFGTGEYFRFSVIRQNGWRVIVITLMEALSASVFLFILTYWILGLNLAFSIVLAALGAATAPASTIMTIRQTGARGTFVNTLLQLVALDDIVGLVAYSIAIFVAVASQSETGGAVNAWSVLKPILLNLGVLLLGGLFGIFLKLLMPKRRSTDNRLIITIATLLAFCGICALLEISPLLGCMAMGTVYINITDDEKMFRQLEYFSPPILLLFFVRSGACFDLGALFGTSAAVGNVPLLLVGVLYFVVRILGKYAGSYFGALMVHSSSEIRNYLGLALIPQAGVAIGLAALGARTLGGETGKALQTVILASSVLYELIGPVCAKLSLYLSKSYSKDIESLVTVEDISPVTGQPKTEVEKLIERIRKIQEGLPQPSLPSPEANEQAFTEAAEEQYRSINALRHTSYNRH